MIMKLTNGLIPFAKTDYDLYYTYTLPLKNLNMIGHCTDVETAIYNTSESF